MYKKYAIFILYINTDIYKKITSRIDGEMDSSASGVGQVNHWKRTKLDPFIIPHTRLCSKEVRDVNALTETIKILEGKIVKLFPNFGESETF